jgi:hypothetical protein
MTYYPVETRIVPLTMVRRERVLPARGEVLVQRGQFVSPADIVARCELPGKVCVVDVCRALGVPREQADSYLRKAEGDAVHAGDVLAAHRGLLAPLQHKCRTRVDGRILTVYKGLILIQEVPTTFELSARLKGQVTNIISSLGVVIGTAGSLIQGVWGSGGEEEGILKLLVDSPEKPLRTEAIDVSCHGTLIVCGNVADEKALKQAVEAKVRGIIAGSVDADLCPTLQSLPFPVMITEGFGALPMADRIFSLLQSNAGREAMLIVGEAQNEDGGRPELVIPLRTEDSLPKEQSRPQALQVGMQVRVVRTPYLGAWGTVTDLPALPQVVESGARLPVAEVDLGRGAPVWVPLANLELIR